VRLAQHRQDARRRDLPQARRRQPRPSGRPGPGAGPAGRLTGLLPTGDAFLLVGAASLLTASAAGLLTAPTAGPNRIRGSCGRSAPQTRLLRPVRTSYESYEAQPDRLRFRSNAGEAPAVGRTGWDGRRLQCLISDVGRPAGR